jgi:hypothetical protein
MGQFGKRTDTDPFDRLPALLARLAKVRSGSRFAAARQAFAAF